MFKRWVGYIAVLLTALIFTFYLDGENGVIILTFLISAPIISLVVLMVSAKNISVSVNSVKTVDKHKTVKVIVKLNKKSVLPSSFIDAEIYFSPHFIITDKYINFRTIMFFEHSKQISCEAVASISGNGTAGIKRIYLRDFLGLFRFEIKTDRQSKTDIIITPELHDINKTSDFFTSVKNTCLTFEDDGKDRSSGLYTNTSAGYEHREYVQGDPLKKINWKLSAKKNKLMVRLDEVNSASDLTFVYNTVKLNNRDEMAEILLEERLLEGFLSMVNLFIKQGVQCSLLYEEEGKAIIRSVASPDDVQRVGISLASLKFTDKGMKNSTVLSESIMIGAGVFVIYSVICDEFMENLIETDDKKGIVINKVYADASHIGKGNVWVIAKDFDLKKID